MLLFLAIACAHRLPAAPDVPSVYAVTAILGSPGHYLTSTYRVEVARGKAGARVFRTAGSKLVVEEKGQTWTWDAAAPDPREPWVVTQERAVSAVPVSVTLDDAGRPAAIVDEPGWRAAVEAALTALALPVEAQASGAAMIDPHGVITGLARDFPGLPPAAGPWTRTEWIGDRELTRTETCTAAEGRWTCDGTAAGVGLEEGTSHTEIAVDARGLVSLDARWDAIAVSQAPGGAVGMKVVAGRRRVEREGS
jgi:hypothetical protein